MLFNTLALIATLAVAVNCQGTSASGSMTMSMPMSSGAASGTATAPTTSSTAVSPCILECSTLAAAQNNCTSLTDLACICTNAQFQADAGLCLTQHCTPADQAAAAALQSAECGTMSATAPPTGSAKPVSFTTPAASATASGTTPPKSGSSTSATATPSKAAGMGLQAGVGAVFGAILAGVLAL